MSGISPNHKAKENDTMESETKTESAADEKRMREAMPLDAARCMTRLFKTACAFVAGCFTPFAWPFYLAYIVWKDEDCCGECGE